MREVLGVTRQSPRQIWLALAGDPHVPPSRLGPSSVRIFTPRLGVATWSGRRLLGRTVPIVNLANRTPSPIEEGWSVRVTRVRDFRGGRLTYDSHNGTDFAVPPGTDVVAAAGGVVASIRNELNRGGLKVYVDHGEGLMTSYHHLARALVDVGTRVARGQRIALSGYSGIDAVLSFPWVAPHVHFNTMLGGRFVDPFAADDTEGSLWRAHNAPRPFDGGAHDVPIDEEGPTRFDDDAVAHVLADLVDERRRKSLAALTDPWRQAWELAIEAATYPTRFASTIDAARPLFPSVRRAPRLDLPFAARDFDDTAFADDVGLR